MRYEEVLGCGAGVGEGDACNVLNGSGLALFFF
jgi:hypothetical protein